MEILKIGKHNKENLYQIKINGASFLLKGDNEALVKNEAKSIYRKLIKKNIDFAEKVINSLKIKEEIISIWETPNEEGYTFYEKIGENVIEKQIYLEYEVTEKDMSFSRILKNNNVLNKMIEYFIEKPDYFKKYFNK
ncbi:hypothetical protein DLH72_01220 [Candidatus Gracilibacteria bacterium]|nr:MAG: hypothetical protein DLH72_01220 [Candidatus Gracilibacteria bacterium]